MKIKVQGKTYEVSDEFRDLSKADQQKVLQKYRKPGNGLRPTRKHQASGRDRQYKRFVQGGFRPGPFIWFWRRARSRSQNGFGLLGDYGDKVKDVRQEIADYQALNPGKSISAEIGGAIIPTAIAGLFSGGTGSGMWPEVPQQRLE